MNSNNQSIQEYWPVSAELMSQYNDGSHTEKVWNGNLIWYQNGHYHRDGDLPAKIYANGHLEWWKNGEPHRFCGPAIVCSDGRQEWWINGEDITEEVNEWLGSKEWQGTPEQIFEFQLRFT